MPFLPPNQQRQSTEGSAKGSVLWDVAQHRVISGKNAS